MELTWDNAKLWQENVNENKSEDEPQWSWDCNFKLDFDGPILSISSRFYPPHKNAGDYWEGILSVMFGEETILEKKFKETTLDELKTKVEKFAKDYKEEVKLKLK